METTKELLKEYIVKNNHIKIDELICSITDKLIDNISNKDLLSMKEHPNQDNIKRVVELYEVNSESIIELIAILIKYGDIKNNLHYQETIEEVFDKLIKSRKNETDGFGYIWKHLSNYPLLLLSYSTNIMLLKKNEYKFLYKMMNLRYKQRSVGYDFTESLDITLPEAMNCYHLFNDINYMNVDIYQYLPDSDANKSDIQKRLVANNRVYKYFSSFLAHYFTNENDFSEYFDLYEYFLGLFFMDKRLTRSEKPPDRKLGTFAPYGRRYWMYSESGRYFSYKDSIVYNFVQETVNLNNDVIQSGFFGSEKEEFNLAYEYYIDLLRRLTGY
ncbi:MAG TPA: hypothetical protein VIL99_05800 [Ignavibacteria bacterium]